MKKKALHRKLTLSKQTIAHLGAGEMQDIAGGTVPNPVSPVPGPIVTTLPCTVNCTPQTLCAWITSCYTCIFPICP